MNKMCELFSGGRGNPAAAILYHADAEWAGQCMLSQKPAKVLTQNQIDFDIIPQDVFQKQQYYKTNCKEKHLYINELCYQCLIVPFCEYIGEAMVNFLQNHNFTVIFLESKPLKYAETGKAIQWKEKKEHVVLELDTLADYIKKNHWNEFELSSEEPYLRSYHYTGKEFDGILFCNEHPSRSVDTVLYLPGCEEVYVYDVLLGTVKKLVSDCFRFPIDLFPLESTVFVLNENLDEVVNKANVIYEKEFALPEACEVIYYKKMGTAGTGQRAALKHLCNLSEIEEFKGRSGHFKYTFSFVAERPIGRALIDLEEIEEIAEAYLNGKALGVRISKPYQFEAEIKEGSNQLEIIVTNTLDKEIFDPFSYTEPIRPTGILRPIKIHYSE